MPHVVLPSYLVARADHASQVEVTGATAGDALLQLERLHPRLAGWVLDEKGALRRHVQVFRGNERVSLDTPVAAEDELHVVAAISGG